MKKSVKKSTNLLCVKAAQGLGSVKADSSPDPESKSGPKRPGSGSGVRIRPKMAWIRTPFFLYLQFSLRFAAFNHSKKGVEQKAKAKAKSNGKVGPSFFT
jgi:hypothetical protein